MLRRLFRPLLVELAKLVKLEWLTLTMQIRMRRYQKAEARRERAERLFRTRLAELKNYLAQESKA